MGCLRGKLKMSTVQVEVLRKEAAEKEKEEIERIREKYRKRQKQGNHSKSIDPERQALIQQAQKQEQKEKEQLIQKYKKRQTQQQTNNPTKTANQERQALIQQAQKQEQKEKEQLIQKYKKRLIQRQQANTTPVTSPENKDIHQERVNRELNHEIIEKGHMNNAPQGNYTLIGKLDIENFEEKTGEIKPTNTPPTTEISTINEETDANNLLSELEVEDLGVELEEVETVDRSALMAKYNLQEVQEDDVDQILQNFDRTILDEDIEVIEKRLMNKIKKSTLSHPKIEWVNVLVFFDEEELAGSIKIFAEYVDGGLLNRMRSADIERLELELMQLALYDVWDVFTTLGVNIDDLESKLDVEVELDRA